MNKLQWNFNRNSNIFIQENAFENVVCEMASICLGLNVLNVCFIVVLSDQLMDFHYSSLLPYLCIIHFITTVKPLVQVAPNPKV